MSLTQFPTGVTLGQGNLKVGALKGANNCFMEDGSR